MDRKTVNTRQLDSYLRSLFLYHAIAPEC
jgi:hypothetical protein